MVRRIFQPADFVLLAFVCLLSSCTSSHDSIEKSVQRRGSDPGKSDPLGNASATAVKPARWVATLYNGDKPGNGYELFVRAGKITAGTFYLLDPSTPHDLKAEGQKCAFENIVLSKNEITFSITLKSGDGTFQETLTTSWIGELSGMLGEEIKATVGSSQPNSTTRELLFIRVE